ncbi:truA1 [Scenedesmus sp. PABB004]|nr:truA1 [Scenedesmus sp. PABB004]
MRPARPAPLRRLAALPAAVPARPVAPLAPRRLAAPPAALPARPVEPLAQGSCRLKLTVAYDGTSFAGFQFQAGKVRTVQGELERAAARVLLPASRVVGASRTDGGAHAAGQVAHLDVAGSADGLGSLASLLMCFNGVLPDDVKLRALELAPPGFDAHFSSVGKAYVYRLSGEATPDPLSARARWWVHDRWCERARGKPQAPADLLLDVAAMAEAAAHLTGVKDFSTFADNKRPAGLGALKRKKPKLAALAAAGVKPVRTPEKNTRLLWRADVVPGGAPGCVDVHLEGSGFLYRMVRVIAAGLVEVGHGRLRPAQFKQLLDAGDRARLEVEAAPPHGLVLERVLYELPPGVDASLLAALPRSSTDEELQAEPAAAAAPAGGGAAPDEASGAA